MLSRSVDRLDLVLSFLVFCVCFSLLFFATCGTYGYNDDYVILGLVREGNWGFGTTLFWFTNLAANSGREIAAIFQSLFYPRIQNVSDLSFIRVVGILGWGISSSYIYLQLRKHNFTLMLSLAISLLVWIVPGSVFLTILTAGFIYSWIFLFALVLSAKAMMMGELKRKHFPIFFLGALCVAFGYQPMLPAVLFFPIVQWMNFKSNRERTGTLIYQLAFLVYGALLVNYIYVRIRFSESRISGNLNLINKIKLGFSELFPMISVPQLFLFLRPTAVLLSIASLILILSLWVLKNASMKKPRIRDIFLLLASLLGWMPITSFWLLLVPEDKLDFRRIYAGSIIFLASFLCLIFAHNYDSLIDKSKKRFSGIVVIISIFGIGTFWSFAVKESTTSLQVQEYNAALCASREVKLDTDSVLASDFMTKNYRFKEFAFADEFAQQSLNFPNPRTYIPFMSDREIYSNMGLSSPQGLKVSEKGEGKGRFWSEQFSVCFDELRQPLNDPKK